MQEIAHHASRAEITIPVSWGSERKVAYVKLGRDLPDIFPTGESFDAALDELKATVDRFSEKHQPAQATRPVKAMYCRICESNGFPSEQVKWPPIYKPGNLPLNVDGSQHVHRQKGT